MPTLLGRDSAWSFCKDLASSWMGRVPSVPTPAQCPERVVGALDVKERPLAQEQPVSPSLVETTPSPSARVGHRKAEPTAVHGRLAGDSAFRKHPWAPLCPAGVHGKQPVSPSNSAMGF